MLYNENECRNSNAQIAHFVVMSLSREFLQQDAQFAIYVLSNVQNLTYLKQKKKLLKKSENL